MIGKIKFLLFNSIRSVFKIPFLEKWIRDQLKTDNCWFYSKMVPGNNLYPKHSIRRFNSNGLIMEVDISDYVGHYIYFGFPELAFQNFKNFIKEGDVILDIGANIGFTALNFAKLVGPTGTVYAFEPDPYNYLQLENNWRLNKLMNLKLINIGLGSTHQIVKLKTELEDNRGKNRVDFNATENFAEVSIVTIDDFVKNANIKFVHLIKIDVEGYEYEVLKGAKNVLKVYKPKLFVEIDEQNLTFHKSSPNEVVSFLLQIGYTTFKDAACGKDIYLDTDFSKCHFDLLVY